MAANQDGRFQPTSTHQDGCFKAFMSGQVVLVASGCCPAPDEEASGTVASSESGPTHGSREGSEVACYAAVMAACAPTAAAACFESVAGQPACAALRRGASDNPSSTCVSLERCAARQMLKSNSYCLPAPHEMSSGIEVRELQPLRTRRARRVSPVGLRCAGGALTLPAGLCYLRVPLVTEGLQFKACHPSVCKLHAEAMARTAQGRIESFFLA